MCFLDTYNIVLFVLCIHRVGWLYCIGGSTDTDDQWLRYGHPSAIPQDAWLDGRGSKGKYTVPMLLSLFHQLHFVILCAPFTLHLHVIQCVLLHLRMYLVLQNVWLVTGLEDAKYCDMGEVSCWIDIQHDKCVAMDYSRDQSCSHHDGL